MVAAMEKKLEQVVEEVPRAHKAEKTWREEEEKEQTAEGECEYDGDFLPGSQKREQKTEGWQKMNKRKSLVRQWKGLLQMVMNGKCRGRKMGGKWEGGKRGDSGPLYLFRAGPIPLTPPCTPCGNLPLEVASVELLGNVHSATTFVKRDLGFQGKLGNVVLLTYGDTLFSDETNSSAWRGMTSDSAALATTDPLVVWDTGLSDNGYPVQFCPVMEEFGEDPAHTAMGVTNVVELSPGRGLVYFLKNHRPNGINRLIGAGVASVCLTYPSNSTAPVPVATRLGEYWWDAEIDPWYGDVCAMSDGKYIYAYGHAKANEWVYVSRVPIRHAFNLSNYEYWNGDDWQSELLAEYGEKEAVFGEVNQGQVFFSRYWGCYVFVYVGMLFVRS
ncbi:MAG: hypothetical protein Q9227_002229 [Pyrenula ochraceoflavens]